MLDLDPGPVAAVRAKRPKHLPVVLTKEEAMTVIAALTGVNQLVVKLIFGSGSSACACAFKTSILTIARSACATIPEK